MQRNFLIILFLFSSISLFSQSNVDSLWAEWNNESRHDTSRLKALNSLIFKKYMYIHADSALMYLRMYYQFAEQNELLKNMGMGMSTMGQCYLTLGKIDSALISFERAIEYSTEAGNLTGVAGAYINRGIVFNNLGRAKEALEEYDKGIEICDQIGELDFKLNGLNNKGVIYLDMGEYDKAIPIFKEVIEAARQKSVGSDAHKGGYVNLGFAYARKGDHASAIENYNECINLIDEYGGAQVDIYAFNFLGNSYSDLGETENALKYLWKSYEAAETLGEKPMMSQALMSIGQIHQDDGKLIKAREMYERSYQMIMESQHYSTMGQPIGKLAQLDLLEGKPDSAEYKFRRLLKIATDQGKRNEQGTAYLGLGDASNIKARYNEAIELFNQAREIGHDIGGLNIMMGAANGLYYAYKKTGQSNLALASYEEYILYRDSLERDENKRAAIQQEFRYAYNKQALADSLEFAKKEAEKDLEIIKRDTDLAKQRIGLVAAGIGLLLLILLAISIRRGKKRSDELLHNILPEEVASELKQKGAVGSKRIEQVTVLFTDFQQFSAMAEKMSASDLVSDLNIYFSEFDKIMAKYKIEKIKTIGDAYMAAAGLPLPDEQHAFNMIQAAFDIRDFVENVKNRKIKEGLPYFEIRIGVHTGPVVAGIVGVKKFQYDIWGDTVNIANRMESSGNVGKVNISQATYELVKDDLRFSFTSRGKIEAKGKGEMEMYFIEQNKA